jgi:hypothetical protein
MGKGVGCRGLGSLVTYLKIKTPLRLAYFGHNPAVSSATFLKADIILAELFQVRRKYGLYPLRR